jgi:Protein involved in meta-pathway of phenol degradation
MKHILCIWTLIVGLLFPGLSLAGNSPRDYIPLDPGTGFLALYYDHGFGNELYSKGSKKNRTTNLVTNVSILRPVYFTQIGPFTIDPQFLLPFGEATLSNDQSSGVGDLTLAATVWFINNKENKFIFAYTPFLTIPTGQYDRDSSVNLGANRWATKHEICVVKGFGDRTWLEVAVNAQFFFDNDNAAGDNNRKVTASKRPVFGGETHLSYDFTKEFFGSVDYYYANGGETSLDGVWQNDWVSTHTAGVTFAYMLTKQLQFMTHFNTDLAVYNGIRTSTFGVRLGFIF